MISDRVSISKKTFHLQMKILGQELHSPSFDPTMASTSFNKLFVFDILSQAATLKQCLSEQPPLEIALLQSDNVVCQAKHFLDSLELDVPASVAVFLYSSGMSSNLQPRVTLTLVISPLIKGDKAVATRSAKKEATVVTPSAPPLDEDTEVISDFSKSEAEKGSDMEVFEKPEVVQQQELPITPIRLRATSKSKD